MERETKAILGEFQPRTTFTKGLGQFLGQNSTLEFIFEIHTISTVPGESEAV
jgi:hypothetical protein